MKDNSGMLYLLLGGAALVYWYMSQQPEDAVNGQPAGSANGAPLQPPLQGKGPTPAPPISSYPVNPMVPVSIAPATPVDAQNNKLPPQGHYASDPVVPLAARLVAQAQSGSQNVDEWNYHYQQLQGGAEQPDPLTFLPEGFDRTQNISATDYIRYRGLGRAAGNRYTPQASRIIRSSSF